MVDIDYMIKNDAKGYFGAFSKTGKNSAEILSNVRQKDRLLNPQKYKGNNKSIINFLKRNGYHNIYGDDEIIKMIKDDDLDDSQIEEVEEEVDIFKLQNKRKKEIEKYKKPKIVKNTLKKYFHRTNSEAYKFHDLHRQKGHKKRESKTPNCTKYLPSKEFVWKRTLVGPKWDKLSGRLPLFGVDNTKYYLNHEPPLKNIGKIFIDMDKQTMRGGIITNHDLRIITTKTFIPKNKKKINKNEIKDENRDENNNSDSNIELESEYSAFNKTNPNMFMKYENSYIKGKQKRIQSASTRPQTGHPKTLNTLTSNNSKQINNTSNSIGGRNITINSKINNNINAENLNNSLSEQNNNNLEINSVSSSELNDSYNQYKTFYQRQIKTKSKTQNNKNIKQNKRYSYKSTNNTPIKNKMIKNKNRPLTSNNSKIKTANNIKKNRPNSNNIYNRKLNINKNKLNKKSYKFKSNNKRKIKGPDFDKTISREYYANLSDHGASLIPFSLPNFKQVRERPLTMVVYERPIYTKNKREPIMAVTPDMYNDIYKYLEYTNNHTRCVPPNFDKMKARPSDDKSPLPVYMKGTVSRGACETVDETSLKMNNYAEGKFLSSYTSFWPKKSFNKIVNLNLLKSNAFLTYLINKQGDLKNANNYIAKSMKFYHKNYEDLLKEGMLSRFDNVTLKTIRPEIKSEYKNLDKFLEKFGSEGNLKNKQYKKNK